jgi:UDP-N-acetylmuramate dehydrogenase
MRFADYTTLHVGGEAANFISATNEAELITAIRQADQAGIEVLILGGGSNLLVSDEGFSGLVVHADVHQVTVEELADSFVVTAACGEPWDAFVVTCLSSGFNGLEALSGIPGTVGATPIQNVGAYGTEVSSLISSVRVWDRQLQEVRDLTADDCEFTYRGSIFKKDPNRFVILAVSFMLTRAAESQIAYAQLADALGLEVGDSAASSEIRDAVLHLRLSKAMVLVREDHDSWSAGSFFTNPIVDAAQADALPTDCPRYPSEQGVKISAAWLIEQSGITRGYGLNDRARISTKHTLALTNRGTATAEDILELARDVRSQVQTHFGIELHPEVRCIGCAI